MVAPGFEVIAFAAYFLSHSLDRSLRNNANPTEYGLSGTYSRHGSCSFWRSSRYLTKCTAANISCIMTVSLDDVRHIVD
jgi:hypothetical protein